MRRSILGAALGLAVVASACASDDAGDGDGAATVVVSSGIWGGVVEQVAGDCAEVEVLIPPGVDPHGFELSARDAAGLRDADLVLVNGLGLEAQIDAALASAEDDGVALVAIADRLDLEAPEAEADDEGDEHEAEDGSDGHDEAQEAEEDDGHGHGDVDPHVWQDPRLVAAAVPVIAEQLAEHTDCDPAALDERAAATEASLLALDEELEAELAGIPTERRKLVTSHASLDHFADRFDFEVVGSVVPSATTLAEPSSAQLRDLADALTALGVDAVFTDPSQSDAVVEALVDEVGRPIEVIELYTDALGEPGSGADTYEGMMRTNVERIRDALAPSR